MDVHVEQWSESTPPDGQELITRLETEGYSISQSTMQPGEYLSPSSGFVDESYWIVSGELSLEVDYQQKYTLRAGDRAFLPAETSAFGRRYRRCSRGLPDCHAGSTA